MIQNPGKDKWAQGDNWQEKRVTRPAMTQEK